MSNGLKKELKHSSNKWGWEEKRPFRQAQKELIIRKSTKIVRSEPLDKRIYKRLVNVPYNRVHRRNEN